MSSVRGGGRSSSKKGAEPVNAEIEAERLRPKHYVPVFREDKGYRWIDPEDMKKKLRQGYVECEMTDEVIKRPVPRAPKVATKPKSKE